MFNHRLVLLLMVSGVVFGQVNSDYFAYPRNYTDMEQFVRDNRQLTFNRLPGLSVDYQIGGGDVLMIEIVGAEQLNQSPTVHNSGTITFPLLGTIDIANLTPGEIETKIAGLLAERKLLKDPEVLVHITSYSSKEIFILGEVDRPGQYVMSQPWSLMDAILIAGGLDFRAEDYGYLHRRISDSERGMPPPLEVEKPDIALPGTRVQRVDLRPLKTGGTLENNFPLQEGDVFMVPRRLIEVFYVIGDVKGPGVFEIPPGASVTASQAISWAGGPTRTSKLKKGSLVRHDKAGQRSQMPVDYAAILTGKQKDASVQPNDILFIPGSESKTLAYGLLNTIPGVVQRSLIY